MPKHAEPEQQRRADLPSPAGGVEPLTRLERDDSDPGIDVQLSAAVPLTQGEVGDLVPVAYQALGEMAIPTFAAAHGVGKQAVVDDADAHDEGQRATVGPEAGPEVL